MRPEVSRVRRGLLALLKGEWLSRPVCRRGLIRPPLVPGQNPGSETRQKLVILHGPSSSIRDCLEGNHIVPMVPAAEPTAPFSSAHKFCTKPTRPYTETSAGRFSPSLRSRPRPGHAQELLGD